jgi:hypothetical protein
MWSGYLPCYVPCYRVSIARQEQSALWFEAQRAAVQTFFDNFVSFMQSLV